MEISLPISVIPLGGLNHHPLFIKAIKASFNHHHRCCEKKSLSDATKRLQRLGSDKKWVELYLAIHKRCDGFGESVRDTPKLASI
jgi:hypothetical protein